MTLDSRLLFSCPEENNETKRINKQAACNPIGPQPDTWLLYLTTSTVTGNILTLELWHFSGEVAAQATPAEIQTQQHRIFSNTEDAFTQLVQEYLGRERQAQLLGLDSDPEFRERMDEFMHEAYDSFIGPSLPTAIQDCAAAPSILSRALGGCAKRSSWVWMSISPRLRRL